MKGFGPRIAKPQAVESHAYEKIYQIEEDLWWYRGRRRICFGLLDRYLEPTQPLDILDVGCGTGYNMKLLQRFGDVRGVDMSPEAIELCRRRGVEQAQLQEAEELPFDDERFDLLTAFDVIEHIEDDRKALREFGRVLRPRGHLLIYTPALPWLFNEHDRLVHHQRRYLKAELKQKLEEAGYEILHLSYSNLLILPVVLLARLVFSFRKGAHQEMAVPPEPFNSLFTALSYLEAYLVNGPTLPYGMSLAALALKK